MDFDILSLAAGCIIGLSGLVFLFSHKIETNQRTDKPTDQRTDRPSYKDVNLKRKIVLEIKSRTEQKRAEKSRRKLDGGPKKRKKKKKKRILSSRSAPNWEHKWVSWG